MVLEWSGKKVLCVFAWLMVLLMVTVACQKESYREYVEVRRGERKFGQLELTANFPNKDILNRLTNPGNLSLGLEWVVPETWTEQPGRGVRLATFKVSGSSPRMAEVTLISFPGVVGGLIPNFRRWLNQVGLELPQSVLTQLVQDLEVTESRNRLRYFLIDFEQIQAINSLPHEETILASVIKFEDETLFIKMKGTTELIEEERERFIRFVDSIRLRNGG